MRSKQFRRGSLTALLIGMILAGLLGPGSAAAGQQAGGAGDQKYAGSWVGSYSPDNGDGGTLSYLLSKDEKGQWHATVKWTNQDGEQTADLKELQIADGKLKGKVESPDGEVEVTIEGQFQGERLEGTYTVSPKGQTEVVEKGTWKTAKSAATKAG